MSRCEIFLQHKLLGTQMTEEQPWWKKQAQVNDATQHGLTEQEFETITQKLDRALNMVELGICAALFSEHCSYKSTKVHLQNLPSEGERVLQGPGENAGVIDIGDNEAVVFKVESHNHPTFIEPFQGAATGVGGILRDVFTMGARPLALMNSLRFGKTELPKTQYLLRQAVKGIGTYGNCMGVPTVGGETFFHKAYDGNCLVNAFALGLVKHDDIFLGAATGVGNSVLYVGSKTGRDGIHGATMSSEEFRDDDEGKRPTVQVGDPYQEKLLLEACLEAMQSGAIVGIQDMGAAGMTSSTYEMADRAETGVRIDLDLVPQRETNMNPYEIMLSESQERMLVVVAAGREQEIIEIFNHWELDAVKIGEVTEGKDVVLAWHGEVISEMPVALLTSAVPKYRWPEEKPDDAEKKKELIVADLPELEDVEAAWQKLLTCENICSKRPLYQQYDSTVRSNTVIHPGGDAAVIRIKNPGGTEKGVAMTLDCNSRYCELDPYQGAALSVAEGCRNITAVGATPIGISDCLNYGSPEKPQGMWQIAEGIRGLGDAARAFKAPIVSGNVSLYNETSGSAILPTPTIALVGLIDDVTKCVPSHFKSDGDRFFAIGTPAAEGLGASEYLATCVGVEKGCPPQLDYKLELKTNELIRQLIHKRLLRSCHDISSGGFAIALAECCFDPYMPIGARAELCSEVERTDVALFSETGARYIFSFDERNEETIRKELEHAGVPVSAAGRVGGDVLEIAGVASLPLAKTYEQWQGTLEKLFS